MDSLATKASTTTRRSLPATSSRRRRDDPNASADRDHFNRSQRGEERYARRLAAAALGRTGGQPTSGACNHKTTKFHHRSQEGSPACQEKVEVIKTELHGLLKEQQKALELASTKWESSAQQAQLCNLQHKLYLGRDEEIVCIQEGEAAPVDEPISIRQTILFMDEETTLYTEEGGIDFKNLDDFDKWLCEPNISSRYYRRQKGSSHFDCDVTTILRQRRYLDANHAKAGQWGTYILVRNGQKLWRIWNEIELPDHLFPNQNRIRAAFFTATGTRRSSGQEASSTKRP